MELIIEKLVSEYMKLDEVEAITLAGSRASGRNDSQSDIDLDLFVTRAIPIAKRREIASKVFRLYGDWKRVFWKFG